MSNPPFGQEMYEFKIVLVGDGEVGKTTFVKRLMGGEYETKYVPTMGVEIHDISFDTSRGSIKFRVWDTAGQQIVEYLRYEYYDDAKCAIIMFDVTCERDYVSKRLSKWQDDLHRAERGIPIALVGNKVDERRYRQVQARDMVFHLGPNVRYFDVSAKWKTNIEQPLLWLARVLLRDDSLVFVDGPGLHPPEILIDDENHLPDENDEDDDDDDDDDVGAIGE